MTEASTTDREGNSSLHKSKLEEEDKSKLEEKVRSWLSIVLSATVSLIGLAYLIAIPFGGIGNNRLGTTEAIIFAAILLFNSALIGRLEKLSISAKGIELQVREVKEEQKRQQAEIKTLRFLISYFVTERELKHLQGLIGEEPSLYRVDDWDQNTFATELRRLRSLGLIKMRSGVNVVAMPKEGDLKVYCKITTRGEEYLKLREDVEAPSEVATKR